MTMNDKKVRKRRIIKDGIVDIDDIQIEPGFKYSNWIPIVRGKMSEREHILLKKRIEITNKIILSALQKFYAQNKQNQILNKGVQSIFNKKFINGQEPNNIVLSSKELIIKQLNAWKGVQRSKKTAKLFRDYFKISKNWWDQKKIELISIHFWVPIIKLINNITKEIGSRFFAQNDQNDENDENNSNTHTDENDNKFQEIFCEYLNTLIFKEICKGMLKMANSRERLLIPAGVYIILYNKQNDLPAFVKKLLCGNAQIKACVENGKGGKHTRDIIVKTMENKCDKYEANYIEQLQSLTADTINNVNNIQMKDEHEDEHEDKQEHKHPPQYAPQHRPNHPYCTSLSPPSIDQNANIQTIMSMNSKQEQDELQPQPNIGPDNIIPTYSSPMHQIDDGPNIHHPVCSTNEWDQNWGDLDQMMMDNQPIIEPNANIYPPHPYYPRYPHYYHPYYPHPGYDTNCNQIPQHQSPQSWSHSIFHHPETEMSLNNDDKLDVDVNHPNSSSIVDNHSFDDTFIPNNNSMFHFNQSPQPQIQSETISLPPQTPHTSTHTPTQPDIIDNGYIPPPQFVIPPPQFNNSYPAFNNYSMSYANHHSSSFNSSLTRYSPY